MRLSQPCDRRRRSELAQILLADRTILHCSRLSFAFVRAELTERTTVCLLRYAKKTFQQFGHGSRPVWSTWMTEAGWYLRIKEHRGCGIRAVSYKAGPKSWIPEACVWLQTDSGARKLWVRSFAHCFASENVTFPNKIEADNWALNAARAIIDKALPDFEPHTSARIPLYTPRLDKFFDMALRPIAVLRRATVFRRAG